MLPDKLSNTLGHDPLKKRKKNWSPLWDRKFYDALSGFLIIIKRPFQTCPWLQGRFGPVLRYHRP